MAKKSKLAANNSAPQEYELDDTSIIQNETKESNCFFAQDNLKKLDLLLEFLYEKWWKVDFSGLESLPESGPALVIGNSGSQLPWPGLMLLYALRHKTKAKRQLKVLCDLQWLENDFLKDFLLSIGFVPFSAANASTLFKQGDIVAIFPEGVFGLSKPFSQRHRLKEFDWTRLLPAIEENIPLFPMSTVGCDESIPVICNSQWLARLFKIPAFPITLTFPLLPFPTNIIGFPGKWLMKIQKPVSYNYSSDGNRENLLEVSKETANYLQGEIQAEINRLLRARMKTSI